MAEDVVTAYQAIVDHLKETSTITDEELINLKDTAKRAAKALAEMVIPYKEMYAEITKIVGVGFPPNDKKVPPMVVQGPIRAFSICPHHLLPVEADIYTGYIPCENNVLGLSKLARIAITLAKRPVLQEQLTEDIADVLCSTPNFKRFPSFKSEGSAVYIIAKHSCMSARGIGSQALTSTTAIRGAFLDGGLEERFLTHVKMLRQGLNT